MDILQALLAFALLMVSFTTIVTLVVELVQRALQMRYKGLEMMLGNFFDKVLWPQCQALLAERAKAAGITLNRDNIRAAFMAKMLQRPTTVDSGKLIAINAEKRSTLHAVDFIELLADTEIGEAIKKDAEALDSKLDQIIGAVLQRYEQYGASISAFFKLRSQLMTVVISVLLAFVMNLDAAVLYQHFATDPDARNQIIAQQEQILNDYQQVAADAAAAQNEQAGASGATAAPAESTAASGKTLEEIEQELVTRRASLASLNIPMGYEYAPWNLTSGGKPSPGGVMPEPIPQ